MIVHTRFVQPLYPNLFYLLLKVRYSNELGFIPMYIQYRSTASKTEKILKVNFLNICDIMVIPILIP